MLLIVYCTSSSQGRRDFTACASHLGQPESGAGLNGHLIEFDIDLKSVSDVLVYALAFSLAPLSISLILARSLSFVDDKVAEVRRSKVSHALIVCAIDCLILLQVWIQHLFRWFGMTRDQCRKEQGPKRGAGLRVTISGMRGGVEEIERLEKLAIGGPRTRYDMADIAQCRRLHEVVLQFPLPCGRSRRGRQHPPLESSPWLAHAPGRSWVLRRKPSYVRNQESR